MDIVIDAMGGDNAPDEIVKGAVLAAQKYKSKIILVGNKPRIEKCLRDNEASTRLFDIVHTDTVITMEDDPMSVVRAKKDSSMAKGLYLLKESADAFVSAGNTGALQVGASLIIRPIKGVYRSAIATMLPFDRPMLLIDCGANVNVTSNYLVQWAKMGSIYMKNIMGLPSPEVGLLNNGTESHKGTQVQIEAFASMTDDKSINFIGNIESKSLPYGVCDVLVTDGFTGNITLKLIEGLSSYMFSMLKDMYTKNAVTKLSFLPMKDQLRKMKHSMDASEYGGAPLLGLRKTVIKAHGSSDARAIYNAVKQAHAFIKTDIINEMTTAMESDRQKQIAAKEEQNG